MNEVCYILTVSGFDTSGCAGVQADNRVLQAIGAMPLNVITANTLQTPNGVQSVDYTDAGLIEKQMRAMLDAYPVSGVKLGMLGTAGIVKAVAAVLRDYPDMPIVLDPVLYSTSGRELIDADGIKAMVEELMPLVTLVTPNLNEWEKLKGEHVCSVLVKGGHGDGDEAIDTLLFSSGHRVVLSSLRIQTDNTRGTGCVLSSAVAAYLAFGDPLGEACRRAKALLHDSLLRNARREFIGNGPSFLA